MRDLTRATIQFACEVTIYACERILEHLAAERPNMDDPLPDGHTDVIAETLDDCPLHMPGHAIPLRLPEDWS